MLVVRVDLLAELVDKLVEAEVDLGLDLVVEILLAEDGQSVVGAVVVQVQRIEYAPENKEGPFSHFAKLFFEKFKAWVQLSTVS